MKLTFARSNIGTSYRQYGCRINEISVDKLFEAYFRTGFIYPEKLRYIEAHLPKIKDNWDRLLHSSVPLLNVVTSGDMASKTWATIAGWRSTTSCWHMQHLASMRNPLASCAVLLAEAAVHNRSGVRESAQMWFRPENRYAKNVFGTIDRALPAGTFSLLSSQLFMLKRSDIASLSGQPAKKYIEKDEIYDFARMTKGNVFVETEMLDHPDFELSELDKLYKRVGLRRYRKGIGSRDGSGNVNGVALVYRGPVGLNLSFLENRTEILLPDNGEEENSSVLIALLKALLPLYDDFEPDSIPVSIDARHTRTMRLLGFQPFREYEVALILTAGVPSWYGHIEKIYAPVLNRAERARANAGRA